MELEEYLKTQRMYWYVKALKEATALHPEYDDRQLMWAIGEILAEKIVSKKNQRLLQLYFCQNLQQRDVDEFLANWDIETVHGDEALLLSYVQKTYPKLNFGAYSGPRLHGLFEYHRFHNLELMAHFAKIVKALNKENIEPLLLKGGAMKFLRPKLPRIMGDMDVLVSSVADYHKAQQIVRDLGYMYIDSVHSVDVHLPEDEKKGIMDIHQCLSFVKGVDEEFIKGMFARATRQKIFNADGYLPCPEDLVFISLNNIVRNLRDNSCLSGVPFAIIDLAYLIGSKEKFAWSIVAEDIRKTHQEAGSYLGACFVNRLVPNLLPMDFMETEEYRAGIIGQLNFDREYIRRIFENKFIWWFSMFRKKVKKLPIFTWCPWLMDGYIVLARLVHDGVMGMLEKNSRKE